MSMRDLMHLVENKLLDVPTPSPESLAKKYGVSVEKIESEISKGIKIESEHTSDPEVAREIALDHLSEKLDYYELLAKVEEDEAPQDELADLRECHAWLLRRVAEARDIGFKRAMRKRANAVGNAIKLLESGKS